MVEVILLHIPKTGGTSLRHLIYQNFEAGEICHRGATPENCEEVEPHHRAIVGHRAGLMIDRFPEARQILFVRDPVERFLSTYFYYTTSTPDSDYMRWVQEQRLTVLDYLKKYQKHGYRPFLGRSVQEMTPFYVGRTEHLQEDVEQLAGILGWHCKKLPRLRQSPRKDPLPAELMERLHRSPKLLRERADYDYLMNLRQLLC